jgi:hypothetical protein
MKKPKKDQRTSTLFIRYIPVEVKLFFKAHCAKRGKTMSQVVIKFMKDSVRTDQEVEGRNE